MKKITNLTLLSIIGLSLVLSLLPFLSVYAETTLSEPVVIGVPTSLGYPHGAEGLAAVEMAVEEINAQGGVSIGGKQRLFEVESIDDRSAAPGTPVSDALMAYEKLILQKHPHVLLVGTFRSEVAIAAMDLLSEYKIIELSTIHMSPTVTRKIGKEYDKYKYNFRLNHDAIALAKSIAAQLYFLRDHFGVTNTYIINEDAAWANGTARAVAGIIQGKGFEVVGKAVIPLGATDYSAPLLDVADKRAQTVCSMFSLPEAAIMVRQMYDMKIPALLMGNNSHIVPGNMWKIMEGKLEYAIGTTGELALVPSEKYPKSVEFFNKFKARLGHWPDADHGNSTAYDGVYIFAEAIERANSLDPEKLIPALEDTDYKGTNGRMRFNDHHQIIFGDDPNKAACEVTFQWMAPGVRVPVLPESTATGEIKFPPWVKIKK